MNFNEPTPYQERVIYCYTDATTMLCNGNVSFSTDINGNIRFDYDLSSNPTQEQINEKAKELIAELPYEELREQRNRLLAESDWIMLRDVKLENIGEWETYRQALRDLPKTQTNLETDEIGKLLNVEYPTKPQ